MYLDYDTYLTMGGTAEISVFSRLEYQAQKRLDRFTQGRIQNMETVPEAVQRCMTELVNLLNKADPVSLASAPVLSGFSNDGYSESYAEPMTAERIETAVHGLILDFLAEETDHNGTPLLWLGAES